ncbi:MAG: hypothetical protein WC663_00805 [Patescibacteria group bacterium]|jgi:hypothetical protein
MPQTQKTEVKTRSRTSQITGVVAAVVAAIGIGALIYFAVVNYNTKITTQTEFSVFEQEYQPNVEPVSAIVTDQNQLADAQTKLDAIKGVVTPVIEQQAQDTGTTPGQIIDVTQKDAMIESLSDQVVSETATEIKDEVNILIGKDELDFSQAQAAEDYTMIKVFGDLTNATGGTDTTSSGVTLTDAQKNTLDTIAENTSTDTTQKITEGSTKIARETSGNESEINSELTAEVISIFGQATDFTLTGTKDEFAAAEAPAPNEVTPDIWFCNSENNCQQSEYATLDKCKLEKGIDKCFEGNTCGDCKQAAPVDERVHTCSPDNICMPSTLYPTLADCVTAIGADKCFEGNTCVCQATPANEPAASQFQLYFCLNGNWTSDSFGGNSIDEAKQVCSTAIGNQCFIDSSDPGHDAAKEACKPAVDEPVIDESAFCVDNACVPGPINVKCTPPNCPERFDNMEACNLSDCEPKQEYVYCAETGCLAESFSSQGECEAQHIGANCKLSTPESIQECSDACIKMEQDQQYYTCDRDVNQCKAVQNLDECEVNGGTKYCTTNNDCCKANVIPVQKQYYYCDKNDKTNGCKQTELLDSLEACQNAHPDGGCIADVKKAICDETCKPDPVLDVIEDECHNNLPNDPKCSLQVIDKIENKPTGEITEYKLSVTSSIIYRGLGRVIMKFWANPNDPVNFEYTKQKLANDFKDNKLRVRFGDKKEDLSDVLKVYKDPRNPNKYYAIAYKLNIDNLWQNDDGKYNSKKYFYQVNADNKKSDFFDFQSLQRGGEVLYVKNRLYNGHYDLKKYGTIELNLKNSGQLAGNIKTLNNKLKNFENGGVNFWTQTSKVSPYGLRTAMAGDQRFKQYFSILKNLQKKNDITKAVQVLYNYHDRLKPEDIYRRYDQGGVNYWVKQVNNDKLSFSSMVTYVMLGTDEPKTNLTQFWGTGKLATRKAEIELGFVKSLSRGITQMSDIDRFMNSSKYISSASIRADLRNSDEFRRLLNDVYKRGEASDAISLLYIADLGRPVDPDGQPFYVNKFNQLRKDGLNATDALNEIDKELTSSKEYKDAIARPIK